MHELKPIKLHAIIGSARVWTDGLWEKALTYLRENTSIQDAITMAETLAGHWPPALFKIDYLRRFRSYPPSTLLGAFDTMRQAKAYRANHEGHDPSEPVTIQSLLGRHSEHGPPPRADVEAIVNWCKRRSTQDDFPVEAWVRDDAVTLVEHWPDDHGPIEGASIPVKIAQLRYTDGSWHLYWRTPGPDDGWHHYDAVPAALTPATALDELDRDPGGLFWG